MENVEKVCIVCKRNEKEIPLVKFDFLETHFWICPQHIPVIIHDPEQLKGMLPGADKLSPA